MLKERVLKRISFVAVMMLAMTLLVAGQSRSIINFNKDWKFHQANDSNASRLHFDDASWRKLHVPHDWSIESDFSASFPATNQGGGCREVLAGTAKRSACRVVVRANRF